MKQRPRGFFEKLLSAFIWITPSEDWIAPATETDSASTVLQSAPDVEAQSSLTGEQVKAFRQARKWSQRKLAQLSGLSQGLISMIENGERSISPENEQLLNQLFSENA